MDFRHKTFFGRRKGKGMSSAKEGLISKYMGEFEIKLPNLGMLDFYSLFDFKPRKIFFEIGYGDGEHLVNMAIKNPDCAFIGTEVFVNGNAAILKKIIEKNIKNIRIFPDDVNLMFPFIRDEVFDEIFILYPDPWPKNRNENRRMVRQEMLPVFNKMLKSYGKLLVVSDHSIYVVWVLFVMQSSDYFAWEALKSSDFVNVPVDWETTRYEQKALCENRVPIYLSFMKK